MEVEVLKRKRKRGPEGTSSLVRPPMETNPTRLPHKRLYDCITSEIRSVKCVESPLVSLGRFRGIRSTTNYETTQDNWTPSLTSI